MKIEEEKSKEELARENSRLREQIRQLTIEKYKLEDTLYRAFRKCLNTKKRKIMELEKEVHKLRDGGDSNNNAKRSKRDKPKLLPISSSDEDGEEVRKDSNSSDTDLDEDTIHALNIERNKSVSISSTSSTSDRDKSKGNSEKSKNVALEKSKNTAEDADDESDDSQGLAFPFPKGLGMISQKKKKDSSSSSDDATPSPSKFTKPSESSLSGSPKNDDTTNDEVCLVGQRSNPDEQESQNYDLDNLIDDL